MWEWIAEYKKLNANAISGEWFISPLEYPWPQSKQVIDSLFSVPAGKSEVFDSLVAIKLYKSTMDTQFRSSIMVAGFMRQNISKTFGLEIENGLMHFYQQDWLSAISQWIYVLEGYSRGLFNVSTRSSSKPINWTIPEVPDPNQNDLIKTLTQCIGDYFTNVLFIRNDDDHSASINRHLILHGNSANSNIYNQKNALLLLFSLDALLYIEMAINNVSPGSLETLEGDLKRIDARKTLYEALKQHCFSDIAIFKKVLLKEHV